jgi:hypothetical protein
MQVPTSSGSGTKAAIRLDSTYKFADVNTLRRYSLGDSSRAARHRRNLGKDASFPHISGGGGGFDGSGTSGCCLIL